MKTSGSRTIDRNLTFVWENRRWALLVTGLVIGAVLSSQPAWSQGPTEAPAPATPAGGGAVLVRSLWTEIFVTVLMVGFALLAICRSSNRS